MNNRPKIVTILTVILFIISIAYFFYSGAISVNYLLGNAFDIDTGKNFIDFLIGILALISSAIVFVGAIYAWNMKTTASSFFIYGTVGFIIKNILEIANEIINLTGLETVTKSSIWYFNKNESSDGS